MSEDEDNIERQRTEISLLEAIYPSEFTWVSKDSNRPLSFTISLENNVCLRFLLPSSYPSKANPIVSFSAPKLSKSEDHSLQLILNDVLSSLSSSVDERLLDIIESFRDSILSTTPLPIVHAGPSSELPPYEKTYLTLIWFHHLLSTTKRKAILTLDNLRGLSKPGYPGILVLQGSKSTLEEAITELKQMKWQAMQVRGEIETSPEQHLREGMHEVETVAEVVEQLDKLGLGEWCLSALRMK